jgi:hypothetical protein
MPLRAWSVGKLGRVWLLGLGLQVSILGAWAAYARLTETPEDRQRRADSDALRVRTDSVHALIRAEDDSIRRGLRPPRPALSAAQEAQLRQLLRDSMGITWETRGNQTTVHLPPPLAKEAGRAVTQMSAGFRTLFLLMALLLLPIPATLLVVTGAWLWLRRPWKRPVALDAAV